MYTDMDWWTRIRLEVLRGESSKREIAARRDSLGDLKEDIRAFRAAGLSSEGAPFEAEDWSLP